MKKSFRSMAWIMIALIVCMTLASPAALAESSRVRTAAVGASITIKGTAPKPTEDYEIVMEAKNASNPMPEGSVDGRYVMTITGANSKMFPETAFSRVGIYKYEIYQLPGDNKDCRYDSSVYTLVVTVTNDGEGGFDIMAVLHAPDAEHKPDETEFINVYPVEDGDGTPTGVNDSWPIFLACSVVLLAVGILLFWWIRRRDEDEDEFDLDEE